MSKRNEREPDQAAPEFMCHQDIVRHPDRVAEVIGAHAPLDVDGVDEEIRAEGADRQRCLAIHEGARGDDELHTRDMHLVIVARFKRGRPQRLAAPIRRSRANDGGAFARCIQVSMKCCEPWDRALFWQAILIEKEQEIGALLAGMIQKRVIGDTEAEIAAGAHHRQIRPVCRRAEGFLVLLGECGNSHRSRFPERRAPVRRRDGEGSPGRDDK